MIFGQQICCDDFSNSGAFFESPGTLGTGRVKKKRMASEKPCTLNIIDLLQASFVILDLVHTYPDIFENASFLSA